MESFGVGTWHQKNDDLRSFLSSCALISHRVSVALAEDSVLILHRSQWQCLAKSYSEVLQSLAHLLQHAVLGQVKLLAPLLHSMQEAERCIEDCTARRTTFSHSWLLDKALKLGASSDVVNLHLRDFLWSFAAVLNHAVALQTDTVESDLVELTRALSDIWACEDTKSDLSEACNFLNTIKAEEEGETSLLADFILHKLSHAQDLESGELGALPTYLWIDPGSLTRNPEILGLGGYGKVHEAGWLGGCFAVKDFFYVESNAVFGREVAIQARLRHPNVISLVCCTKNPSLHKCSLVMELMHQDLRVLMIEKIEAGMDPPFSLGVAVDLMLQIAQGLEYLHSLHIMHRDLKSSNILVSFSKRMCDAGMDDVGPCAHLKIADFGMSKAKHASSKFTTKQVGATPWRAPEVFEVNPEDEVEGDTNGKYTKKADVYSFGLVCYEILTGKPPFEGNVRKKVLAGERPLLPNYCPPALSSYIARCWHAEPWRRPPFSQICRMLRYSKACILQQVHHDQSPAHHSWLLHPLSADVCARIDDMVISFMQPVDTPLQPQPVNIPLEMHCCRVILKGRDETERASNEHANGRIMRQVGVESNMSLQNFSSIDELQQNGHGHGKSSSKAKSYSIYVSRWLKNLFCIQSAQLAKTELQAALGLVRDFTIEELRLATANFQKLLGEGATGAVYYGKLDDGREIAVKVAIHTKLLRSGHIVSTSESTGLVQELRIASQLRHRNIVPLFGWCQDRGKLLLVFEFMLNGNLARHIFGKRNSLNWQQRYDIIFQLASALKYLHQDSGYLQIVHRDVKASNVLLDSGWNARLGDCGLAVLLRNGDAPMQSVAGTFGYISPESVTQGRISPASDVYAFGVTVLEIATGRRAYAKDEMGETHYVRDRIWRMYLLGDLMEVADVRLGGKFEEVEMNRLLLLGLSCTSVDPGMRPPIEEVLRILLGASEPAPGAQTIQFDLCSGVDSTSSTSTWSFWNRPTVLEHTSFDDNEESGPLTPITKNELEHISNVRVFTYNELKLATRNFRPDSLLGEGGFGLVFKGSIKPTGAKITSGTTVAVAVKNLNTRGLQGHREWLTEVIFLAQLYHPHLVKLIGYCCEKDYRLVVYEFMQNGSLEDRLFGKTSRPLPWALRMKIALGAAKGLAFLHGYVKPIIYRDFKPSNILLDSDYTAKLSDFGLVKHGPEGDATHVSTRVIGTYGYVAPEYVLTGHLTWRSDVFGFGIVLLQLLTGQKSINKTRANGKEKLIEWAGPYLRDKRRLLKFIDPKLEGMYSLEEVRKAAALALHCLSFDPKSRPSMSDAVQILESLQNIK